MPSDVQDKEHLLLVSGLIANMPPADLLHAEAVEVDTEFPRNTQAHL